MIDKRLAILLLLAGTSLPGCIAVAIPAIAGSAIVGSRAIDQEGGDEATAATAQPTPMLARAPEPEPEPASPVASVMAASAAAEAMPAAPAPSPLRAPLPPVTFTDPDRPIAPEQASFAHFVRYGHASARGSAEGAALPSAMLADPVALDGKRRRCAPGEQLVALIDLDPAGAQFAPPTSPAKAPGLALGLAMLREAGIEIAWISDLPSEQSGLVRAALEASDLDPRGEDIISLRRDGNDSKARRKESLAGVACIVAIAGDERPDFDDRFTYLINPAAGAGLEPLIGDGWFLIEPLLGK